MVAQISERRRNANRVDHEGACKRKLCIYRIDKSGCQGTRDTSQGLGRVEESHDKVFLFRIRLICHHILEDRDDVLNVFVHAGKDYRAKRIVLLYGETDKPPAKRLAEKDKKRALNYRHYTGREWGDVHNYDLSLDSGRLTPEGCVEIITRVVQEKNK